MEESHNAFLGLFPHRYDYIWAEPSNPNQSPEWKTESRYPLSDRLIQQGGYLYGVRFGAQTQYCLIDIDAGSAYHPSRDSFAISRIAGALEPLGLVEYLVCTSSYSGGLHLYFPFSKTQSSWQLAIAVSTLLENSGFKLVPGQLEVFPNPKPYVAEGQPSLFNAHRLPLQTGSYLLNDEFQPIWSTRQTFVQRWHFAQSRNDLDTKTLKQILKQAKRRLYRVSGKAEKFINDLNTEIELGWTGPGQTNRLLGRITMRAYIFHHILSGGQPLQGAALVEEIVETAKALPGYEEWCQHRHEIEHRAEEWARCIESSHYFHYGDEKGKFKAKSEELEAAIEQAPSWNQQQSESARDRIRSAIADLLEKGSLPTNATARFKALVQYRIGGGSLYRHRDLWHPNFLTDGISQVDQNVCEFNSNQKSRQEETRSPTIEGENLPSLLSSNGGNIPAHKLSSDFDTVDSDRVGRNRCDHQAGIASIPTCQNPTPEAQAWQAAQQEALHLTQHQTSSVDRTPDASQVERMQQYFNSGDPILQAEAFAWSQRYPGWLSKDDSQCPELPESRTLYHASVQAVIRANLERLGWTPEQVSDLLQDLFNKTQLFQLTNAELLQWLTWLQGQT